MRLHSPYRKGPSGSRANLRGSLSPSVTSDDCTLLSLSIHRTRIGTGGLSDPGGHKNDMVVFAWLCGMAVWPSNNNVYQPSEHLPSARLITPAPEVRKTIPYEPDRILDMPGYPRKGSRVCRIHVHVSHVYDTLTSLCGGIWACPGYDRAHVVLRSGAGVMSRSDGKCGRLS